MRSRTLLFRFTRKVKAMTATGCWLWVGAKTPRGYGQIRTDSSSDCSAKSAHRVSYELFKGPIPTDMFVCHHCDIKLCVNPMHLFIGTAQDNYDDMKQKGREVRLSGEEASRAKLTAKNVRYIKNEMKFGTSQAALARMFNVTTGAINHIKSGRTWSAGSKERAS